MRRQDFHFDLPDELIADHPLPDRAASRLLCLNGETGALADRQFADVVDLLRAGDVLVVNDTRVLPARLHGVKQASGGRVEVLVERVLDEHHALAHVRANKTPKSGAVLRLEDAVNAEVLGREGELFRLRFDDNAPLVELLERHGHMPLPPYIRREDEDADRERYQTVYARELGAVAAPTAGLHFTEAVLQALKDKGVQVHAITLHVGAGTFQPVRVDDIRQHTMHAEVFQVSEDVAERINRARDEGRRVVAVGTTVVRALESAAERGRLGPFSGETRIFITPGYRFQVIDGLITNFHLPESTLIMLVSALAGYGHVMDAYRHAVAERYRFFSYGDAMFIHPAHPEARP